MTKAKAGVTSLGRGLYRIRTQVIDPKTGRRRELDRRVSAKSKREAAEILASVRADWLSSRAPAEDASPRRLGEALDAWLTEKKATVKPSTASTYGSAVAWWTAILGDYLLDRLDPADVRDALAGAREGGDASETLAGRLRVLRTFAREEGHEGIVRKVSVKRDVHEAEDAEDHGRGLSLEELRRFLAAGPTAQRSPKGKVPWTWSRAWALVACMAWTGMRFGEASALEWRDIDLKQRTIRVRRAQWRGIVGHTKAKASARTVVIPAELADLLAEHRHAMVKGQQPGVSTGLVFPSRRKGARYVANVHARKAVLRVCEAAGIDLDGRPAVHMLRHSMNNLVRQNASELVRRSLIGHADDASGERYSSVTVEERRSAVAAVVQMVKGGER